MEDIREYGSSRTMEMVGSGHGMWVGMDRKCVGVWRGGGGGKENPWLQHGHIRKILTGLKVFNLQFCAKFNHGRKASGR
jgi:hypothetical protein